VGVGVGQWAAEEEVETEEEAEAEAALRSVFPRDPELFADAFPVRRQFQFCGRSLRIVQRHGPGLGTAGAVWEAVRGEEGQREGRRSGDVTITDQPVALEQIRENVGLNFPGWGQGAPRVQALRWGLDQGSFPGGGFEVILGSDIVYDPASFVPLLRTLRHLCGPSSLALLSVPVRGGDRGSRYFFNHMVPPHFMVQLLQREPQNEIEIYGLSWKGEPLNKKKDPGGGGSLEEWEGEQP
ncbi:EFMT3 methyltransferase, partial [Upupa epops]|nr:EFMT3 methyltransferase [Upupa epops]